MLKYYGKDLFKKCFDMNILDDLKMKSVDNGHPSKQFEPCFYVALKQNNVDFNNNIDNLRNDISTGLETINYNKIDTN